MHRLYGDSRGLAMIEGAILAPVLIIVLIGMVYLQRTYSATLRGGDVARTCAWVYAASGCKNRRDVLEAYPACQIDTSPDSADAGFDPLLVAAENTAEGSANALEDAGDGTLDGVLDALDGLSDVAIAMMGMRDELRVSAGYEVIAPPLFGGTKGRVGVRYTVMCNEVDWSVWDFLDSAMEGVL